MAYAALVSCASVFGASRRSPQRQDNASEVKATRTAEGDAYAWFCVALLLDAIKAYDAKEVTDRDKEHRQKLLLALVSTVPSVSLRLLPRLLTSILERLEGSGARAKDGDEERFWEGRDDREELVKAIFEELLNVGDEEKEYAIWWWGEHKGRLAHLVEGRIQESEGAEGNVLLHPQEKGKAPATVARL